MEYFLIYLLTVGWAAVALAEVAFFVVTVGGSLYLMVGAILKYSEGEYDDFPTHSRWLWARIKVPYLLCAACLIFVPTKGDIYFIAGGGLSLMAAQNEEVQQIPMNAAKAVNTFLLRLAPEMQEVSGE